MAPVCLCRLRTRIGSRSRLRPRCGLVRGDTLTDDKTAFAGKQLRQLVLCRSMHAPKVDSRLKSDATKALFKRLPRFAGATVQILMHFHRHLEKVQMSMIRNRDCGSLKSRCDVYCVKCDCVLPSFWTARPAQRLGSSRCLSATVLFEATRKPHLVQERILGRFVQQELRNQPPVKKVCGQPLHFLLCFG